MFTIWILSQAICNSQSCYTPTRNDEVVFCLVQLLSIDHFCRAAKVRGSLHTNGETQARNRPQ
jgi:hypothetical protein